MNQPEMMTYGELRGDADVWPGNLDRSSFIDSQFQAGMYLDDCAKAGNWDKVLEILEPGNHLVDINQSRPATSSRSTVLHRAAEGAAPVDVIEGLLQRGAFRSLRDRDGLTAFGIATGNAAVSDYVRQLLRPEPSPLDENRIAVLEEILAAVLDGWIQPLFAGRDLRTVLRYPPVAVLHEAPSHELWVQLPFMAGFRVALRRGYLDLVMGQRNTHGVVAEGWVITHRGPVMVYPSEPDSGTRRKEPSGQ